MRPDSFSLNPYEVLGVSPNASNDEIQTAYRQHALRWHPDHNPNDEYALRMMQRVNAAWTILKDEQSRAAYDRWQAGEANTASGPDAWEQPPPGPPPGGEWYRPPPVISCPRCNSTNDETSICCDSCGYPFGEAQSRRNSSSEDHTRQYDATANSRTGQLAGYWIRLMAFVVDTVTMVVVALLVALALEIPVSEWSAPDGWNVAAILSIVWLLGIVHSTLLVATWSTTLGKQLFGLRVVRTDGSKVRICRAFSRALSFFVLFSPIILVISSLMIALRRDKRGLHDSICDTKVVYR